MTNLPPMTARELIIRIEALIASGDIDPNKPLYVEYREWEGWRYRAVARRVEWFEDTHECIVEGWQP